MARPRPKPSAAKSGGKNTCPPHDYRLTGESGGMITHTCKKCGDRITRQQGRALAVALPARRLSDLGYLLAAVAVLAITLAPFWYAARWTP